MTRPPGSSILLVCLLAAAAGVGAYLIGAGSVAAEGEVALARAEAGSKAFAEAVPVGAEAGRDHGREVGALANEALAAARGGRVGARAGSADAARRKRQERRAEGGASATTRAEAERTAPDLAGSGGILVVGDSLEVLTSPYLEQYLPSARLTVNAEGGYNSLQIFDLFEESYDPSQSVIVFDAGTNDNPAYPEILQGRLDAVAGIVGNRCLVVPTIHGFTVDGVDNSGKNRVVRSFAAAHPGTQTPDWAGFVAAHPELMQSDDLHPTAAGAQRRAQLIAQGVQACLGRL